MMGHDGAMTSHLLLLRAVNVGGNNKVPMAELRSALSDRGLANVSTYIASGNVFVESPDPGAAVASAVHETIAEEFGHDITVICRSIDGMRAAIDDCPYADEDPKQVGVIFLAEPFAGQIDASAFAPDVYTIAENHIYVFCPTTFAKSKLTTGWFEKQTGVAATMRNWNSTNKLLGLLTDHNTPAER